MQAHAANGWASDEWLYCICVTSVTQRVVSSGSVKLLNRDLRSFIDLIQDLRSAAMV